MSQITRPNSNTLNDFFGGLSSPAYFIRPLHGEPLNEDFKVDIKENNNEFIIKALIPGVNKEDIHILVDGTMVTISAEVKQLDEKTEGEKVVRNECYYGSVSRSFQLPLALDSSGTKAHYKNGILKLHLPKSVGKASKQITVT